MSNKGLGARLAAFLFSGLCYPLAAVGSATTVLAADLSKAQLISIIEERFREDISAVKGLVGAMHWMDDGTRLRYVLNPHGNQQVYEVDTATGDKMLLLDTEDLHKALRKAGADKKESTFEGLTVSGIAPNGQYLPLSYGDAYYMVDLDSKRAEKLGQTEYYVRFPKEPRIFALQFPGDQPPLMEVASPDQTRFAFARDSNLWLRNADTATETQLTEDGEEFYSWGGPRIWEDSFWVSWSPDGQKLLALKKDGRNAYKLSLKHWLAQPEYTSEYLYPITGSTMPRQEPYIVSAETKERVRVDVPDLDEHFLFPVGWRANGEEAFIAKLSRRNNELDLYGINPKTGAARLILSEANNTFIDTFYSSGPQSYYLMTENQGFLYLSERNGWRQIYRYDYDGKLEHQLTDENLPVRDIVGVDKRNGWVYYRAPTSEERPYDRVLHRVSLKGGARQILVGPDGQHDVTFSPNKDFFIVTHSNLTRPPVTELRRADGQLVTTLSEADVRGLMELGWAETESFKVKARDGKTDVYGVILKPRNFDPTRKYPIVEAIYGGMQADFVPHGFLDAEVSGTNGYGALGRLVTYGDVPVVFVNTPGIRGRGKAFHDKMHGVWPKGLVEEHAHAIRKAAETRPWMDTDRVGVFGYSWGGYMTMRALLLEPDFYKVGVSGNPVFSHEDMLFYPEPFLGLPADNPLAYEDGDLFQRASNLKGDLLIIGSGLDVNATFAHTMRMVDKLINEQKDFDLLVLPGMNHSMGCCGTERYHYIRASIVQYFMEKL